MVQCCEKDQITPFCSSCGKPLAGTLESLLKHCEVKLKEREAWIDRNRKRNASTHCLEKGERVARKWRGWVKALQKVLK